MKAQFSQVTHDLEQCKLKLNSSDAFQSGQDPGDTARMIAALQDEVRKLKFAGVDELCDKFALTAVFGGFGPAVIIRRC